jgi:hypothetical protein
MLGQIDDASREIERAVRLRRSLSARDPRNVRWGDTLASALATRAELESRRGRAGEARAMLAEALAIRRRLRQESPDFAANLEPLAALEKQVGSGTAPPPGGPPK